MSMCMPSKPSTLQRLSTGFLFAMRIARTNCTMVDQRYRQSGGCHKLSSLCFSYKLSDYIAHIFHTISAGPVFINTNIPPPLDLRQTQIGLLRFAWRLYYRLCSGILYL
ncbi:hypothetical protein F4809DRAFT_589370 [Biscogniauxia mediterranea]|nr:hypothetical protein F4809DRAFT_589370 [Biscogniauxia mediterranea]